MENYLDYDASVGIHYQRLDTAVKAIILVQNNTKVDAQKYFLAEEFW